MPRALRGRFEPSDHFVLGHLSTLGLLSALGSPHTAKRFIGLAIGGKIAAHALLWASVVSKLPSFLFKDDVCNVLKGGVKERQLVNEVLGSLAKFALNLGREDATPIQRCFHRQRPSRTHLGYQIHQT